MSAPSPVVEYGRLLRQRRWRALAIAALVVTVVVALFGGFRKASDTDAATVGAGKTLDAGALRLTPLRAWVARSQPGRDARPGDTERYLMLRLGVDNRTDSSTQVASHLQSDVRWVSGAADDADDADDGDDRDDRDAPADRGGRGKTAGGSTARTVLRADDHGLSVSLPPRLPATVDMVWQLPAGTPMPTHARWRVAKRSRVEQTYLTREGGWLAKGEAGALQLAVEDRLATGAPP